MENSWGLGHPEGILCRAAWPHVSNLVKLGSAEEYIYVGPIAGLESHGSTQACLFRA
jgi:hypothetical protein